MPILEINDRLITEAKNYGEQWSLLFHEFSYWLIDSCQQLGIKKLYFFTREGAFFLELVKAFQEKFNFCDIECHLLSVSRLATFLPSVDIHSENAFQRLWNIYPNQSPKAFFTSLGVQDPRLQKIYTQEYDGDYDTILLNIAKNPNFNRFLENKTVKSIIANAIDCKKSLLAEYLKQNCFFNETPVAVVDIGWRGSIQDNLSLIFPEKKMYGLYFGLHRFKGKLIPANRFKKAFLFDANNGLTNRLFISLMRFVLPFEFLCTPAQGSVKGYIFDKNGTVIAETQSNKIEKILIEKIIRVFQRSVLECMDSYKLKKKFRLKECRKIAKKIVWNPKEFEIFFYQKNKFNEKFGQGITYQCYPSSQTKLPHFSLKLILTWIKALKKSAWISGYLYNKLPKPLFRALPTLYLLYCLLTFDSYLLR
jgi:hypothetical protein